MSELAKKGNGMRQAKLPKEMYENTIEDMETLQKGWTAPWAMSVDNEGFLWLDGKYPVREASCGTATMYVFRDSDGWRVDLGQSYISSNYRYLPEALDTRNLLPVVELIRERG